MIQQRLRVWMTQIVWALCRLLLCKNWVPYWGIYIMARQQMQMAWSRKCLNTATFLCKHACWIFTIRWLQVGLSKCRGNIHCSQCCRSLGDSSQPTNWRPIAVLKITYKIFSRLLYNRLRVVMDEQQPHDQTGFRPITGIDDAFVVLECLSSKSLEWNAPIWFASLDLTKAFDRIEYSPLFDALLQQGVPRCYCTLLWKLYKGQTGSVHGSERFNIERGVKQGDVISPILFNAGLEHAMRKWKAKLVHHGVQLGHGSRLTNIRYADDLMLFALHVGSFDSGTCSLWFATELGENKNFDNVSVGKLWIICWCMWRNGTGYSCRNSAQIFGPQLKWQFFGLEKFWICPSSAGCLEQISQIQTYLIEQACLFGFAAEIIWRSGVSCYALRTCNLAIDKGLLAKTWCRAKTNASVYSWVGSNSWWPELAGHYGANESQIGNCENFIPNGGLGRQTLPIEVSTCTSNCTLTWRMAG